MSNALKDKRIAVLATDGVEQIELTEPVKALKSAGAKVEVVSPKTGSIQGFNHHDKGNAIAVDKSLEAANPNDYDSLLLPGGVINPDALRLVPKAVDFVRSFAQNGKPIAAICHGPWMLINAGAVAHKRMTSWPSLQADLQNAGAEWTDEPVVVDRGLVTSRKPQDLAQFCPKMIEEFRKGNSGRAAAVQ